MSREWVDDRKKKPIDKRWVMRCDRGFWSGGPRCSTESEPQRDSKDLPLERFRDEGWFIADKHGDLCPTCLAAGHAPTDNPHKIMTTTTTTTPALAEDQTGSNS